MEQNISGQGSRIRDFLRIVESMIGAIVKKENIQQQIAEEFSLIMNQRESTG